MFDIGFFELILIGIVALLVIGPERLPRVARQAGLWVGKLQGFVSSVKEDIDQEIKADELKKIMKQHADSNSIHEIIEETKDEVKAAKDDFMVNAMPDDDDSLAEKKAIEVAEKAAAEMKQKELEEKDKKA